MKNKAVLAVLLVAFLLTLSLTVLSDELYITNKGTYFREAGESFKQSNFAPDTYYLNAEGSWYHLERLKWRFPKAFNGDNGNEPEISVSSHNLMMEKFKIYDYDHCQFSQRSFSMFYSDIPKMEGWVSSQSMAARRRFADHYQKLHNYAKIHPAYLGSEIISLLRVYDRYSGGAHGINNYNLLTYTLEGEELKVKDLFKKWGKVKHILRLTLLEQWVKREVEFGDDIYKNDRDDLGMELVTVTDMSGKLLEILENELGDKGFIFTLSKEGVRFNIYLPRYSLGPNPMGGSWISVPLKDMPEKVRDGLEEWISKNQLKGSLPEGLSYFSQRTQLKNIFPKPENFDEEFVIGRIKLEYVTGCLKELLDIIPGGSSGQ